MRYRVYRNPWGEWDPLLLWSTNGTEEVALFKLEILEGNIRRDDGMNQLGKRYRCQVCGTEILCTKAGEGIVACCDKEMEVQEPKPLPSSD